MGQTSINPKHRPLSETSSSVVPARFGGIIRRKKWYWLGGILFLAGLTFLGGYRWQRHNYRRFQEVRPGVLYRMGIPSARGFRQIVHEYGIRTVICLHEHPEPRVKSGWFFDWGEASGPEECQLAEELGVRFLHWPLREGGAWPWPDPEHLEAFFRLMDQPEYRPVLIHCWAGKHRAGTLSALFRLEYDHWPISDVLDEMYSFDFQEPYPLQEHNLRTYVRRPRPSVRQWEALREFFAPCLTDTPTDYEHLIRLLQAKRQDPIVIDQLEKYLRGEKPFALCLADRLLQGPEDPWLPMALQRAEKLVFSGCADPPEEVATAAGFLADYASPEVRRRLAEILQHQIHRPEVTAHYQALVAGLTNRYRTSRLPYLKLLLEDGRVRPEPEAAGACYADTAVARLAVIVRENFLSQRGIVGREEWNQAIVRAKQWFAQHPEKVSIP